MEKKGKVFIKAQLPVSIIREGRKFIAYTPALDLSTSGDSYEGAKKRFAEILDIFFEEIIKKGTLESVLRSLGWRKIKSKWSPPVVVSQESETVQVSLP